MKVKRSRTLISVSKQIRPFPSNFGTSNENFGKNKYSLGRSFKDEYENIYRKKIHFFPEKHCVLYIFMIIL